MIRIIEKSLDKTDGFSNHQRATAAVDRFELALEMEQEEQETGIIDFAKLKEAGQFPARESEPVFSPPLPSPDLNSGRQSSIIIAPDSPEARLPAKEAVGGRGIRPVLPIRNQGGSLAETDGVKKYRSLQALTQQLYDETPETLTVLPQGRKSPVTLRRNIIQGIGMDAAKLVYELDGMNHPSPSFLNADGSMGNERMALDTPVVATFFCADKDLNIQSVVEKMSRDAEVKFRPRPETITPAPQQGNYLRITPDTPAAEADFMGIDRRLI